MNREVLEHLNKAIDGITRCIEVMQEQSNELNIKPPLDVKVGEYVESDAVGVQIVNSVFENGKFTAADTRGRWRWYYPNGGIQGLSKNKREYTVRKYSGPMYNFNCGDPIFVDDGSGMNRFGIYCRSDMHGREMIWVNGDDSLIAATGKLLPANKAPVPPPKYISTTFLGKTEPSADASNSYFSPLNAISEAQKNGSGCISLFAISHNGRQILRICDDAVKAILGTY